MSTNQIFGWAIALTGLVGLFFVGRGRAAGWLILLGTHLLLLVLAVVANNPGFIIYATMYGVVYGANWLTWRRRSRAGREF